MIRPCFTEREGRLLLAAVARWYKEDESDKELARLRLKLSKAFGSRDEQLIAAGDEYASRFR